MTNDAGEQTTSIDKVLETRGSRYGDFASNALLSQTLQQILLQHAHRSDNANLEPYMVEALTYICQKLSRIASGDPFYDDNWVDISGYSTLVVNELHKRTANEQNDS